MARDIHILCVGKAGRSPEAELARRWLDRLPVPVRLVEVEERRPLAAAARKAAEGAKLLAALPGNAFLVALDEHGAAPDSIGLARSLEIWQTSGRALAFAIGGADGLDAAVLGRADARLSLSRLTWPHMLVRAMLAEQLYRATTILAGHPYHRS